MNFFLIGMFSCLLCLEQAPIEKAFIANNGTRVTLISHSLGSLWTLFLLSSKPQSWKDKYIGKWVSVSAAIGGSVKLLNGML